MKYTFLALMLALSVNAQVNVQVNLVDLTHRAKTNVPVTLRWAEDAPTQSGIALVPWTPVQQKTGTNSSTTFTNVVNGFFYLDVNDTPLSSWQILVPTNQGTYSAVALLTNATPRRSQTNFITSTTADARYYPLLENPAGYVTEIEIASSNVSLVVLTNIVRQISSNQENLLVSGTIVLGDPLTGSHLTSTNGGLFDNQQPVMYLNSWNEYNTNQLIVNAHPTAGYNQTYAFNSTFGSYTGITAVLRGVSGTNGGWKIALVSGLGNATHTNVGLITPPLTWQDVGTGTNTFISMTFGTNVSWRVTTYGPITNWLDYSNGVGGLVYSNGAAYQVTSRRGATNKQWVLLLSEP